MKEKILTIFSIIMLCLSCNQPPRGRQIASEAVMLCTSEEVKYEVIEASTASSYFPNLLTTEYWPARWNCGQWSDVEGWMYVISDLTIFLAYLSIPIMLLFYVRKIKLDLKLKAIIALFGAFILLCGFTHLIDAIIFWEPVYRLSGFVKMMTGIVSMGTAVVLGLVIPHALKFRSPKEVKDSEEALHSLQSLYHEMADIATIGTWEVDVASNKAFWSDVVYDIHELGRGTEIRVEDGINFYHPDHRQIITEAIDSAIEENRAWDLELKIVTAKNRERWVRAIGKPQLENGEVVKLRGLFQDITEKVEQQIKLENRTKDLQAFTEKFELAQSSGRFGIWDWDVVKNELVWDSQMFDLYGVCKADFSSEYEAWQKGVHPEDQERSFSEVQEALAGKDFNTRFRIVGSSGQTRHLRAVGQVFRDDEGKPVRMLGTNWDITKEAEAEEKVNALNEGLQKKVEKRTADLERANAELEAFSYSVSHDLRAPLRAINGFSEALSEDYKGKLDEQAERFLERIAANSEKMGHLIDDLLEFSRMNRKKTDFQSVNTHELVKKIISELFSDYEAHVIVLHLPEIFGDKEMLNQVFTNLISNAIKYSSKEQVPKISIASEENDAHVVISVSDNGVGFDMQYSDKLFEVFHRLHAESDFEGTGVGLALCHKIITAHQGEIWAESKPNVGSTFFVKFSKTTSK